MATINQAHRQEDPVLVQCSDAADPYHPRAGLVEPTIRRRKIKVRRGVGAERRAGIVDGLQAGGREGLIIRPPGRRGNSPVHHAGSSSLLPAHMNKTRNKPITKISIDIQLSFADTRIVGR
jgi:hypothetical protein